MDFDELDKLPKLLILELSAKTLGPYAAELRSRYRKNANEVQQLRAKLERTEVALDKARMACKRMSSNKQVEGAEGCLQPQAPSPTPGSAALVITEKNNG